MQYLHDIWVNWFEGEENGYNVCPFHEWRREDKIELLDQVPLLYITDELFDYIENDLQALPKSMLQLIYRNAYLRKGQKRSPIDYACIITNGIGILAIDTVGYEIPVRKSRLIPRQAKIVYDMIKNKRKQHFKRQVTKHTKEYHILSMPPAFMYGLTRRERQLKQILMMALDQLRITNHLEELRYWLTEWEPKKYTEIRHMNENEVWNALYNGVKKGWSKRHEEIGEKMIQGHPFLERMWQLEQGEQHDASKL